MTDILVTERLTGELVKEHVYGDAALRFVYGDSLLSWLGLSFVKTAPFAKLYGWWQNRRSSRRKVQPFIEEFHVDVSEFAEPAESYRTFNEFFFRKLKASARPIAESKAIIPADGRYRFIENLDPSAPIDVKGQSLDLAKLLGSASLAEKYRGGKMVMARLCPTDYHRFHFPVDCSHRDPQLINGWLYSVNPIALRRLPRIFIENRRFVTELNSEQMGKVQFIEVGATCVGSVIHTSKSRHDYAKGDEKGYFEFGASALIILFEAEQIQFAPDLIELTKQGHEIHCLMGQTLSNE